MASALNWQSQGNVLFLNPRLSDELRIQYQKGFQSICDEQGLKGHLGVLTSGTTTTDSSKQKIVFISKEAFLESAKAVSNDLGLTSQDLWLQALPKFHVGGLAVEARAAVKNFNLAEMKFAWDPQRFHDFLLMSRATWTSLVPTQVFDLVKQGLRPPTPIRILVGGGRLSPNLHEQAHALGWRLIPSYGMSELSSTIATIDHDILKPLSHVKMDVKSGRLAFQSRSLFSGYGQIVDGQWKWIPPQLEEGFFLSEDLAEKTPEGVRLIGRPRDVVKVSGELVSLPKLRDAWSTISQNSHVMAIPDPRTENRIVLVTEENLGDFLPNSIRNQLEEFQSHVMPFERIQTIFSIGKLPKTDLGKVQEKVILQMIEQGQLNEFRLN